MIWTHELPAVPGFYWFRPSDRRRGETVEVRIVMREAGTNVEIRETGSWDPRVGEYKWQAILRDDRYSWSGPIPYPTEEPA